jgi:hypothetical protein
LIEILNLRLGLGTKSCVHILSQSRSTTIGPLSDWDQWYNIVNVLKPTAWERKWKWLDSKLPASEWEGIKNWLLSDKVVALHYIALNSLDRKLVTVTVGCGICHIDTKTCTVQLKFSHKKAQEKTVATHGAI